MNKLARDRQERGVEDVSAHHEARMAKRVLAALDHPNNPVPGFDFDNSRLARHIALRLCRRHRGDENE